MYGYVVLSVFFACFNFTGPCERVEPFLASTWSQSCAHWFFSFNPIAIDQHVLHISTSYASPEFTVGICCLLLHLHVVSPISPISYLLGGSECSSFLVPEPPLTIRCGSQRGTTSLTIALPFGSMLAPPRLGIALDFLDVCCCFVVFFLRTWTGIAFKVSMAQFNLPWLAWGNIGGEAEFGAFDNWHWKHNLTNWIHRRSLSNIIYTILEVRSYLLGCFIFPHRTFCVFPPWSAMFDQHRFSSQDPCIPDQCEIGVSIFWKIL